MNLESYLLSMEIAIPVYFAYESLELLDVYQRLVLSAESDQGGTATSGTCTCTCRANNAYKGFMEPFATIFFYMCAQLF